MTFHVIVMCVDGAERLRNNLLYVFSMLDLPVSALKTVCGYDPRDITRKGVNPSARRLESLVRALDVSIGDLLTRDFATGYPPSPRKNAKFVENAVARRLQSSDPEAELAVRSVTRNAMG